MSGTDCWLLPIGVRGWLLTVAYRCRYYLPGLGLLAGLAAELLTGLAAALLAGLLLLLLLAGLLRLISRGGEASAVPVPASATSSLHNKGVIEWNVIESIQLPCLFIKYWLCEPQSAWTIRWDNPMLGQICGIMNIKIEYSKSLSYTSVDDHLWWAEKVHITFGHFINCLCNLFLKT